MRESLEWGEFVNGPAVDLDYDLLGKPVSCELALGFARCGNIQIELLQPVRGEGLHFAVLAWNGPGLYHLGFLVDDLDVVVALGAPSGFPNVMGSRFGSLRCCYPHTWDAVGLYGELVEDPVAMM